VSDATADPFGEDVLADAPPRRVLPGLHELGRNGVRDSGTGLLGDEAKPDTQGGTRKTSNATKRARRDTPREDTPYQAAANAVLAVYGLAHTDLNGSSRAFFGAIGNAIKLFGIEAVEEWVRGAGHRKLGTGQDPAKSIPGIVMKDINARQNAERFRIAREAAKDPEEDLIGAARGWV
jgi:hypothetical protein